MPNNGGVYTWSQTAAANATADNTVNWEEGQAPSSINDSGRAMMASVAKFRDDVSGMIVTTGTNNAYIISSNQQFDSLADLHQKELWFTPHVTNIAGSPDVTVTVDGFANIPIRSAPNTPLQSGVLIMGTPYGAIYNNTDGALYLKGYYGNLGIPFLCGIDYWDTVAPASNFIIPQGQAISRTAFAAVFARWGTIFGAGDGSTTFNVPDKTGRVSAMLEAAATRLTGPTVLPGTATTATNGGTTTLTAASAGSQTFTGSQSQTIVLPVVSTLTLGNAFFFQNSSSGILTINASGTGNVVILRPGATATVTCIAITGTTAASWQAGNSPNGATFGSVGGGESHTLVNNEIPSVPFSGTTATESANHVHQYNAPTFANVQNGGGASAATGTTPTNTTAELEAHAHTFSGNIQGGGGSHGILQPTIICNYIIRII